MVAILSNPALWASLGALLAALGLEMIPAQQLIEHIIAAVAAISGIIGIINTLRASRQPQIPVVTVKEETLQALEKAVTEEKR